ncbi:MAG: peptidoglycan DD-metalloendopeptidase family protein [candidate division WOR-3 bacterium]|nr:MAG: peptidoglycan DD-metalloendopeptidase family protein [candidate division WOR-3 bacterium]
MKILIILICLFSQLAEKQEELNQLKTKLNTVRQEIKDLEKKKVGTLAHIDKIDEGINLTIKYIDELTAQEALEKSKVAELEKEIARLESRMRLKKSDMQTRIVRLYKWKPFYKMNLLFSSKSLPQILSSSYYLQLLAKEDQRAFFEFEHDWKRYLSDKELRKELIETLESRKRDKEDELARLNDERRKKNQILTEVAKKEDKKRALEKELKSAQRKLEELIVSLERQREKARTGTNFLEKNRGKLSWPCRGSIVTNFGKVIHPKYNTTTKNNGIDISTNYGDNVYAVAPGKVVYADRFMGYGNLVLVDHLDGYYSLYGHLAEMLVNTGDEITGGRIIGRVGESGSLSGPILHFELRKDGKPVDPMAYLD